MLEDTRRETKMVLANIDQSALDWTPSQAENSIGTLLYHIGRIELDWLYVEALENAPWPQELKELFPIEDRDDQHVLSVVGNVGSVANKKLICYSWGKAEKRGSLMTHQHPFKWRHFQADIILLCVRWYLRYSLSYRDLEEMMRERGLYIDHTTISVRRFGVCEISPKGRWG